MRKHRSTLLLAGLATVAVVGGLVWLIFRTHEPPEPVYQGKSLRYWLVGYDMGQLPPKPSPAPTRGQADEAIRHIGTNAIPTLLHMLRAHDSNLKLKVVGLAQKQHFIKINFVPAELQNWEAMSAFRFLGAAGSNAAPALVRIYQANISNKSQITTAGALGAAGPAAIEAIPSLLRAAYNTNVSEEVRGSAALALGEIRSEPELVVPALIKCLKDSNTVVRADAARGLVSLKTDAKSAVPALVDSLNDPDRTVRFYSVKALKAIDPEAAVRAGIK